MNDESRGIYTSEFLISFLAILVSSAVIIIQVWRNRIDTTTALGLVSIAVASYGYSQARALVKASKGDDNNEAQS